MNWDNVLFHLLNTKKITGCHSENIRNIGDLFSFCLLIGAPWKKFAQDPTRPSAGSEVTFMHVFVFTF